MRMVDITIVLVQMAKGGQLPNCISLNHMKFSIFNYQ